MAGELVGGALLSAFLQVAFDRLASPDILDYFRGRRLNETLLKNLKSMLLAINEVIDDADTEEITSPNVKAWVDEVKDAVFDAEDILDEIDYEVSKSKQEEAEIQTSCCKVWSFFTTSVSSFDKKIEIRMKQVLDNLKELASQRDILGLKQASDVGAGLGRRVSDRLPSTSLVDVGDIYGRDDDKEIVIKWLLSYTENDKPPVSIISVVGMGGLGKTTLAQLVYNDQRMKDEFNLKAWICISEEFDVRRVTKTILEAITLSTDDTEDMDMLQLKLKENLSGKKFLLVFDDVWNENYLHWEALQKPFNAGAQGSRILVTTRSQKVASIMCSAEVYQLKQLSEEDGWSLFAKHAFRDGDPNSNPDLEEVGRKIIDKCKGLPLALKTIGSLLYTKFSLEEWEKIFTSEIWELSNDESTILPALRLSYQYLPSHLKRCFAYFSLFPKDYQIDKVHLIQLWMAENFLHSHKQNTSLKDVGNQYFGDLMSRSFLQQSTANKTRFVMHDLINDLAKHVSGEFSFRLGVEEAQTLSQKTRHFSYLSDYVENSRQFEIINKADRLHTFLPFSMYDYRDGYEPVGRIPRTVVENLFSRCKSIRALSLRSYRHITELPDSLGNLKHLRYLDLSYTGIKRLPNSTCLLINLQTLKLRHCRCLEELPSDLHKLINLRHLDFHGSMLQEKPNELGKLKNLQELTAFYVGKCCETNITQLGELNLEGTLSILELQNVVHSTDAFAANMKNKKHLDVLSLEWCMSMNTNKSQKDRDVLENLQPHKNIKKLCIRYYGGTRFPNWLTDCSLSNLVFLELRSCKYCVCLPPLGILPSLRTLEVDGLEEIEVIGSEFYGDSSGAIPFVSLEILKFNNMNNWKEWKYKTVSGAFSRLQELHVENCPIFKEHLPEKLASLRKLVIRNCQQLLPSLPQSSDLKFLKIGGCSMDGAFNEEIEYTMSNICLEELEIDDWPKMELPLRHRNNFLLHVRIRSCSSLRYFPLDLFPSLQDLLLDGCSNLEMISMSDGPDQNSISLEKLMIQNCPKFVSFPKVGLPKLKWCTIFSLDNLKALPECMAILLPSLEGLNILFCQKLESFHEGSLPSNLKLLDISYCPKVTASRMTWGLYHHTSLLTISIGDAEMQSFPDEGLLPSSLTVLHLFRCSNLTRLDYKGLCRLPSLKQLSLYQCPRLECLPEEGLPSSLHTLRIDDCSLLKERCQKERGQDWGKVAHIPCVMIDNDIIT